MSVLQGFVKDKYMLKVKSFKISDDNSMNELLSKYRIAQGASILVSDGQVVIPYEDGIQENKDQKFVRLMEEKLQIEIQMETLKHGQKVLANKINGAISQLNTLIADEKEAESKKEIYDKTKKIKEEKKRLESVISQYEASMVNNQAELTNKMEEVKVYNEEIKELK